MELVKVENSSYLYLKPTDMAKQKPVYIGLLLLQSDLDELRDMIGKLPWDIANPIMLFLTDKISQQPTHKYSEAIPKSDLTYSKKEFFKRQNNVAEELDNVVQLNTKENDIHLSRPQQQVTQN
jgi:hypothetical protein